MIYAVLPMIFGCASMCPAGQGMDKLCRLCGSSGIEQAGAERMAAMGVSGIVQSHTDGASEKLRGACRVWIGKIPEGHRHARTDGY